MPGDATLKGGSLLDYVQARTVVSLQTSPKTVRKKYGQLFTDPAIARFMALYYRGERASLRVLDPGAGSGILAAAFLDQLRVQGIRNQFFKYFLKNCSI